MLFEKKRGEEWKSSNWTWNARRRKSPGPDFDHHAARTRLTDAFTGSPEMPRAGNIIQFIGGGWLSFFFLYFINFEKEFVICSLFFNSLLLSLSFSISFVCLFWCCCARVRTQLRWWSLAIDMQTWALTIYKFKFYFDILEGKRPF